jgi:hypothetical protein
MKEQGANPYYEVLDFSLLITDITEDIDLSSVEEVIMIGYPDGLWDDINNKPIIRRGITATHPFRDYKGLKEFMVDMACFPGSSGSPVFILSEGVFGNKHGAVFEGFRLKLLGILRAGPTIKLEGSASLDSDFSNTSFIRKIPVKVESMMHLGLVIKAERIKELEQEVKNRIAVIEKEFFPPFRQV